MDLKEIAFSWAKNILTILTKNINPKITFPDLMFHVVQNLNNCTIYCRNMYLLH